MSTRPKPKGPWINRLATQLFTVILAILILWLLGFVVRDIKSTEGPDWDEVEKRHIDQSLLDRREELVKQTWDIGRQITNRTEEKHLVGESSRSFQQTINQLVELQKLSIQKELPLPEAEQESLTASLNHFLEGQARYQELQHKLEELTAEKIELEQETKTLDEKIEKQRQPARDEYDDRYQAHRLKLAGMQLAILIPLLAVAGILIKKKRASIYFPLLLAFGAAALLKVTLVVHEYFPTKYFKYILIIVLILAVARLLIYFIRIVAYPKAQWLTKQYREAYERFLCPICEYPIRVGPRRFLFWTRRTVNKIVHHQQQPSEEETYTCPSCGTRLYEECTSCQKVRHALLPSCHHCGAEKEVS